MDELVADPEITTLHDPWRVSLRSQIRFRAHAAALLAHMTRNNEVQEIWRVDRRLYPAVGDYENRGECWPSTISGMMVLEIVNAGPGSDFPGVSFQHNSSVSAHAGIARMSSAEAQILGQRELEMRPSNDEQLRKP
jgi:hypothetical protein